MILTSRIFKQKPQNNDIFSDNILVFCVFCRIKLSYCILNEWYLTVLPSFSMK